MLRLRAASASRAQAVAIKGRAGRVLARGLDLVFPPDCAWCAAPLADAEAPHRIGLCDDCRALLVDDRPYCARCGLRVGPHAGGTTDCAGCRGRKSSIDAVVRLGAYEGRVREFVLRMKRSSAERVAAAVGRWMVSQRGAALQSLKADVVVAIPMHWSRRLWRGTNSADTLAEQIATRLDVPLAPWLLRRRRRTRPQADLPPSVRRRNMRGAFTAVRHADLVGARVLVVDDVMTTGATCNEAGKALKLAGAAWVAAAVVGRTEGL